MTQVISLANWGSLSPWVAGAVLLALLLSFWFKRPALFLGQLWLLWLFCSEFLSPRLPEPGWQVLVLTLAGGNLLLFSLLPPSRSVRQLTALTAGLLLELMALVWLPETWLSIVSGWSMRSLLWAPMLTPVASMVIAASLLALLRWVLRSDSGDLLLAMLALGVLGLSAQPQWWDWVILLGAVVAIALVVFGSHRMAFVDTLTGVPNRRAMDDLLARLRGRYAIAMLDIDHFKKINDRHGHDAGDQVLRMVAARVARKSGARFFRFGGEEFALVFRGRGTARAIDLCEDARASIADEPFHLRNPGRDAKTAKNRKQDRRPARALKVTVSLGLAFSGAGQTPAEVMARADKALYRAKRAGRNRVATSKK